MVITSNAVLAARLRLLRNLAFTKPRFRHELAGFNFRMTGYQAALGLVQLKKIEYIIAEKRRLAHTYNHYLSDVPGIRLPQEAAWAKSVYWMYALVIKPEFGMTRDLLMEWLYERGIDSRTFFCPMNQQPCLESLPGFRKLPCPVADRLWETGLYLPSTYTLKERQVEEIARLIRHAYEHAQKSNALKRGKKVK
jgi:perosamine synthetase